VCDADRDDRVQGQHALHHADTEARHLRSEPGQARLGGEGHRPRIDGTHYYQRAYDDDDADKRKRSTIESVERAIESLTNTSPRRLWPYRE
jgi:hypothetical protein